MNKHVSKLIDVI
jgi:hypothetical protein